MNDTTRPAGNCGYSVWYVIERGQAEAQDPPVWWAGYTTVRGHEWTNDPRLGVRFPSRRAASRRLDEISGLPGIHHPMGHVEEYVFMDDPVLSKTDSGYWHARWNDNQWLQWPVGRKAAPSDGFGWITEEMVEIANFLVERESRNAVNQEPRDTQRCYFDQLKAAKSELDTKWAELAALRARVAELESVRVTLDTPPDTVDDGVVTLTIAEAERRIMEELADVVIYAALVASRLGYPLADAIVAKFNAISEREGFPERLEAE